MISIRSVTVGFGGKQLYTDADLFVSNEARIGLVGPNGSGKSTLFRLILHELKPDQGSVEVQRGIRIAHLPQTGAVLRGRTVLSEALAAFSDLTQIETEIKKAEAKLKNPALSLAERNALLEHYAHLQAERDHAGYAHEAQARKILAELGFTESEMEQSTAQASGGFQVRAALARLLLGEPDILLLDEPTNYLDIRAIDWVQEYLKRFRGAFILITHDRYLLDACVKQIWAIERPKVVIYKGNYSGYVQAKEEREAQLEKAAELQQKEIEKTQRFIEQFRARKDTARRVKSRQKALAKMEMIVLPEKRKRIKFRFPEAARVYGHAVTLRRVSHSFDAKVVLRDIDLTIAGGERIALFGANGQGKTTLLRILGGELIPAQGRVWHSEKLRVAFYRQGAEELLDPSLTVIDEVQKEAEGYTLLELRTILGAFLFPGDDIYKLVGVLSGGEKTRLALLKVLLSPSNLLLLDEPTNHLDIESREVLEEAIGDYRNTVIFAAHDRFMIDRLATKTVAVANGRADVFPGNYTYATSGRAQAQKESKPTVSVPRAEKPSAPGAPLVVRPTRSAPVTKPAVDPAIELQKKISSLEERVRQLDVAYEEAKAKLDFTLVREVRTERQTLIDEIIALRNQV